MQAFIAYTHYIYMFNANIHNISLDINKYAKELAHSLRGREVYQHTQHILYSLSLTLF